MKHLQMINYKRAKDLYKIITGQKPAPQKPPQAAAMLRKAQINIIADQLRADVLKLAEGVTPDPGLELPGYLVAYMGQYTFITNHTEKAVTADQAAALLMTEAVLTIYVICVTGSSCTPPPELKGKEYKTVRVTDQEAARQFIEDLL